MAFLPMGSPYGVLQLKVQLCYNCRCESPYHGMNLCCGTAAEGMDDPATELLPLVRDLCVRKKVFNIHFRCAEESEFCRS